MATFSDMFKNILLILSATGLVVCSDGSKKVSTNKLAVQTDVLVVNGNEEAWSTQATNGNRRSNNEINRRRSVQSPTIVGGTDYDFRRRTKLDNKDAAYYKVDGPSKGRQKWAE